LVVDSWITGIDSSSISKCYIDLIKPIMFSLKLNISSKQKRPKPKEDHLQKTEHQKDENLQQVTSHYEVFFVDSDWVF
jgi:hypothetical protein